MFTYVYYDYDEYMGLSYDDIYDLYTILLWYQWQFIA